MHSAWPCIEFGSCHEGLPSALLLKSFFFLPFPLLFLQPTANSCPTHPLSFTTLLFLLPPRHRHHLHHPPLPPPPYRPGFPLLFFANHIPLAPSTTKAPSTPAFPSGCKTVNSVNLPTTGHIHLCWLAGPPEYPIQSHSKVTKRNKKNKNTILLRPHIIPPFPTPPTASSCLTSTTLHLPSAPIPRSPRHLHLSTTTERFLSGVHSRTRANIINWTNNNRVYTINS